MQREFFCIHGFTEAVLKQHFVCFASDGASVMLGSKSDVATVQLFPSVLIWHCMNHCLELCIGDARSTVFIMLTSCCQLALQCLNIRRILGTNG